MIFCINRISPCDGSIYTLHPIHTIGIHKSHRIPHTIGIRTDVRIFPLHRIGAEPHTLPRVVVAGTVIVEARFLVQFLSVKLVGAGPGGVLLLDERLTCGQVLDALHHLAALVGDQRCAAEVVAVVVVRPLCLRHRLERHNAHRLTAGRRAVALGRHGSTGMGAAHEQECGYKNIVQFHFVS